ncbi:MAG: hypothetical protein AMJ46_01755 [Latescibacteria bacterium DG_63]|nr:MAG: hypothetical protein AMJ46_01755 [Latescibacteria bacterium DG_63]
MLKRCLRRVFYISLLLSCAPTDFTPILLSGEETDAGSVLAARIDSLRCEAKYTGALEVAEELLDLRQASESPGSYEVAQTKRLVETLEFVVSMSADTQEELAEADRHRDARPCG